MAFREILKPSFATTFLLLGLCLVCCTQCNVVQKKVGNGIIKTKVIPTKEFNKIIVAGSIEMVITHGDSIKVTCEADSNLIKEVQIFQGRQRFKLWHQYGYLPIYEMSDYH